jgi:hypothetical protein
MKKFIGVKSLEQIKEQCIACGVEFSGKVSRKGSDFILLRSPKAHVLFSAFNGRFFGVTPNGIRFSSDDDLDGEPWFDQLLAFFYVEK